MKIIQRENVDIEIPEGEFVPEEPPKELAEINPQDALLLYRSSCELAGFEGHTDEDALPPIERLTSAHQVPKSVAMIVSVLAIVLSLFGLPYLRRKQQEAQQVVEVKQEATARDEAIQRQRAAAQQQAEAQQKEAQQ